jgi:phosphoribosylanthranilate isomerase
VGAAIRAVRPFAVDVSSGIEIARGQKCPQKMAAFCQAVYAADVGT